MARLFGLIGNRADLAGKVLAAEGAVLRAHSRGTKLGWGLGFYQAGEVLMRRRPVDDRDEIDVAALAADVRADLVLGHVRSATVGALRTENTHPFRYRQWLFAQTGTIKEFEGIRERLLASIPEFLRGSIRGETDAEALFHVFLSFLHDSGRLNDSAADLPAVRDALRSCLSVVDGMAEEVGGDAGGINLLVSNGEAMIAVHRATAGAMAHRTLTGKADADLILGDDPSMKRRKDELGHLHFTLLAADFDEAPPARWRDVSGGALVTLNRAAEPQVEAL